MYTPNMAMNGGITTKFSLTYSAHVVFGSITFYNFLNKLSNIVRKLKINKSSRYIPETIICISESQMINT